MQRILNHINTPISIAPLVVFRVLFGLTMVISVIRFLLKGWIYDLYVQPTYFFTYYGFDWVQPLGEVGMHAVFIGMGVAAVAIMLGWHYRIFALLFFVVFTYVELIDKSNYLNHYYFVSIIAFLLVLVPANRSFSLDALRSPASKRTHVPAWTINIFKLQLGMVYFFAGAAKLNPDWLLNAMPLRLWLPAHAHVAVMGPLLALPETAFAFSWLGAIYDLTIVFFLLFSRTRLWAYACVVAFHVMTAVLFQIGMFPYIMILFTLIYFSADKHERAIESMRSGLKRLGMQSLTMPAERSLFSFKPWIGRLCSTLLIAHFVVQVVLPFRYALYPGELFWTEQGYRFSWRVMLMEKAGYTVFKVRDHESNRSWEIANWDYLTPNQEKMMATQPDMILQFAHFLEDEYRKDGVNDISISVDSYVTLNGHRSRPFIDPEIDLTQVREDLHHKYWVLPFEE